MEDSKTVIQKSGHAKVITPLSLPRGSNCNDLTWKMLVVLISVIKVVAYARWSATSGCHTWMFDRIYCYL